MENSVIDSENSEKNDLKQKDNNCNNRSRRGQPVNWLINDTKEPLQETNKYFIQDDESTAKQYDDSIISTKNAVENLGYEIRYCDYINLYCKSCCEYPNSSESNVDQGRCLNCGTTFSYHCFKCNKLFSTYMKVYYHFMSECARELWYFCLKCTFKSNDEKCISEHMWIHQTAENQMIISQLLALNSCGVEQSGDSVKRHEPITDGVDELEYSLSLNSCGVEQSGDSIKRHEPITDGVDELGYSLCYCDYMNTYCSNCGRYPWHHSLRMSIECLNCGTRLKWQCSKCENVCISFFALIRHLKYMCGISGKSVFCCHKRYYNKETDRIEENRPS